MGIREERRAGERRGKQSMKRETRATREKEETRKEKT
jgi:hypothetical protein